MGEINNTVWATDGSAESEEALNLSVVIAKAYASVIHGVFLSVQPETIISEHLGIPTDDLLP